DRPQAAPRPGRHREVDRWDPPGTLGVLARDRPVLPATVRPRAEGVTVRFDSYSFGAITIDGIEYDHDVVIDHGSISKRHKKASKRYRDRFGHTPLSADEDIPWDCRRLVVGTGASGSLPIMDEVFSEAKKRGVELVAFPTEEAIELLGGAPPETNVILHVTC